MEPSEASLRGEILRPDGQPATGVTGIWPTGEIEAIASESFSDGRFLLPDLRAGLHRIRITWSPNGVDVLTHEDDVMIEKGSHNELSVILPDPEDE